MATSLPGDGWGLSLFGFRTWVAGAPTRRPCLIREGNPCHDHP
jgi:hypothetical protein